ncbi:hypothetical protein MVES_002189 [Malassezia vespertilionis]|uniref:Uncharacterized protein n=1 Tax=Malassezia vespertilionis TaxID=2020962 RepID=A0A2N1JBE6_9BASI|nr:hypothetical protein MVES_002189 [Malassezia vespertilionis]
MHGGGAYFVHDSPVLAASPSLPKSLRLKTQVPSLHPPWKPLAQHLVDAARCNTLAAPSASDVCKNIVQNTLLVRERAEKGVLVRNSAHVALVHTLMHMPPGSVNCDLLLSTMLDTMLDALRDTDASLSPDLFAHAAFLSGTRGMQRTRAWLHRRLTAGCIPPSAKVWRALLDAHVLRQDWARVQHGLDVCSAQGTPLPLHTYTVAHVRACAPSAEIPAALNAVLTRMRAQSATLTDPMLAQLVHTLAAPVHRAYAAHAPCNVVYSVASPVQSLLYVFFMWFSGAGPAPPAFDNETRGVNGTLLDSYPNATAAVIEVELGIAETLQAAYYAGARAERAPYATRRAPHSVTGPIRARLEEVQRALRAHRGLYEQLAVRLYALEGAHEKASALLREWLAQTDPAQRRNQQRTVVARFAHVSRCPRRARLLPLLDLLHIATHAAPGVWGGHGGARTLPRLCVRLLGAWANWAGHRDADIVRNASTRHGWAFLDLLLAALVAASRTVPAPRVWAHMLDDPKRVRAIVWTACCAAPRRDAPERLARVQACFAALRVSPRTQRP